VSAGGQAPVLCGALRALSNLPQFAAAIGKRAQKT